MQLSRCFQPPSECGSQWKSEGVVGCRTHLSSPRCPVWATPVFRSVPVKSALPYNVLEKLSIAALSQASARRLMESCMPKSAARLRGARLAPSSRARNLPNCSRRTTLPSTLDGRGCWRDNVFLERLSKSTKYEEVYLHAYERSVLLAEGLHDISTSTTARGLSARLTRRPRCILLYAPGGHAKGVIGGMGKSRRQQGPT